MSKTSIALHWVIALLMIGMLILGLYMHESKAYGLYPIHKSIGILMLPLVSFRIIWRALQGWPKHDDALHVILNMLAKMTHSSLLMLTLFLPTSGVLMSALSGRGIHVFGLTLLHSSHDANGKLLAISESAASFFHQVHFILSDALMILAGTHIFAAIFHHFILKDGVLSRMLNPRR